jgi:hypothetical protein
MSQCEKTVFDLHIIQPCKRKMGPWKAGCRKGWVPEQVYVFEIVTFMKKNVFAEDLNSG